jgi:extradiol dioxygenase family protein
MTATPVDKTYVMLMVADMTRAMRFYTDAFAVNVGISSPYWSEFTVAGTNIALHPGGSGSETRTGLGSSDAHRRCLATGHRGGRPHHQPTA